MEKNVAQRERTSIAKKNIEIMWERKNDNCISRRDMAYKERVSENDYHFCADR